MTGLNHVIRRGAIYVWRRRISVKVTDKAHAYLQVSLRTSRFSTAKTLANVANFAFATSMIEMEHGRITRAEAQRFLAKLVIDELTRIEENRYFEPQAKSPIEWRTRYLMERNRAIAARLVAARGTGAAIFRDDRAELAADGLTETDMAQIEREIVSIQQRVADKAFIEETCDLAAGELGRNPSSEADLRALVSVRLGRGRSVKPVRPTQDYCSIHGLSDAAFCSGKSRFLRRGHCNATGHVAKEPSCSSRQGEGTALQHEHASATI
jgi:hypothetical protein